MWRRSEALGVSAATSSTRRALLQAFPFFATDFLPYYERILGLVPATGATEAQRRDLVVPLWAKRFGNDTPNLLEDLRAIDARLSLISTPHSGAGVSQPGRAFAPHEAALEAPAFGQVRGHALAPEHASELIVHVLFSVMHTGPLTTSELTVVERVKTLLRSSLSSDTDFSIAVDDGLGAPGAWHVGSTPIGFGGVS